MRWNRLFEGLEDEFDEQVRRERDAEVAERIRAERARIGLLDRLAAHRGRVELLLLGHRLVEGRLHDVGSGWIVVLEAPTRPVLVPTASIVQVSGLGRGVDVSDGVTRRLSLGHALRALARDRLVVLVEDVIGRELTGTIDAVGADAFELARHPSHLPPRRSHVRARPVIPFAALVCVTGMGHREGPD